MKCSQNISEMYQYLQELLILLKAKLIKLINENPGQNTKGSHNNIDFQIAKYLQKISNLTQKNRSFLSICKRFMLGVHQIVRSVQKYVPKYKVQLKVILKKMENLTIFQLNQQNHLFAICKLFEGIVENKECLKNIENVKNQQTQCYMKQTNLSYHLSQSNKKQNQSQSAENLPYFIPYFMTQQSNNRLNGPHRQFKKSFQLKKKQNRKSARALSSYQQNGIVWQISTSALAQSNLMKPQSYLSRSKIQSARTFRTIESEQSSAPTQKYEMSYQNTCRLKEKNFVMPVLNILTIEDIPQQKLKKEATGIKRKRFYIKSIQQNKYRFQSHQQKTRKNLVTTMSSSVY